MASYKDYYETLGVAKDATQEEIRRAFRKLAAKHHPDRNPGDAGAEERFKEINEAYTALSDPEKRKIYDTYGSTGQVPPGAWTGGAGPQGGTVWTNVDPDEVAGFSDFFQSLFGGGFGGFAGTSRGADPFADLRAGTRATQARPRPRNVEGDFEIDLVRGFEGGQVPITVSGKRVTVTVPPGVRHGSKLRLRGQAPGGGDLLLAVRLRPSGGLTLEGDDVRAIARVPDHLAALGGTATVPSLSGPIEVTVPAGSSSGRVLRLRGQGWPRKEGGRGDELVEVRVTVPGSLTAAQRTAYQRLRELARTEGDQVDPDVAVEAN
jgi:curved DNA-binding protein